MSTIRHYRVVPQAMGPLNLLEIITEVPDLQSLKRANRLSSDFLPFFLLSSVSLNVSQVSTMMAEAITTIQSRKNIINHWVLHSPPIARKNSNGRRIPELPCACMLAYE